MSKWRMKVGEHVFVYDPETNWFIRWIRRNGKSIPIPMSDEQSSQAVGNEVFRREKGKKSFNLTQEQKEARMRNEMYRCLIFLRREHREILPFTKRRKHERKDKTNKDRETGLSVQGRANSSVDLYKNGKLKQRRFYGPDGFAEQDFDFDQDDSHNNHEIPHCHIWYRNKKGKLERSGEIPFFYEFDDPTQYKKERCMENDFTPDFDVEEWMERNPISDDYLLQFDEPNHKPLTVFDIQQMLAHGWEIEPFYEAENLEAFIYPYYRELFCIDATYKGKKYHYETDDLDDFGENAMFGPFPLKEIVGELIF